jgi:hypothetical protein
MVWQSRQLPARSLIILSMVNNINHDYDTRDFNYIKQEQWYKISGCIHKWKHEMVNHIRYLSSKLNTSLYMISSLKNVTSAHVLRTMYFAYFHVYLRYGLTLWGGELESINIFQLQRKVVRIIGKVDQHVSCRNLFKDLNILPLPCLYISEVVYRVKSNWEQVKQNEQIHDHYTCQKSDFHTQFCKTTLYKNSCENAGIKLFNKVPNTTNRV